MEIVVQARTYTTQKATVPLPLASLRITLNPGAGTRGGYIQSIARAFEHCVLCAGSLHCPHCVCATVTVCRQAQAASEMTYFVDGAAGNMELWSASYRQESRSCTDATHVQLGPFQRMFLLQQLWALPLLIAKYA
jgi:hypothetical protein